MREWSHFSAFFEIYKICIPLHRSKLRNLEKFHFFPQILIKFAKFCDFSSISSFFDPILMNFLRNFTKLQKFLKCLCYFVKKVHFKISIILKQQIILDYFVILTPPRILISSPAGARFAAPMRSMSRRASAASTPRCTQLCSWLCSWRAGYTYEN